MKTLSVLVPKGMTLADLCGSVPDLDNSTAIRTANITAGKRYTEFNLN